MNTLRISVFRDGQREFRPANLEKGASCGESGKKEEKWNAVCFSSPSGTWHTNYKIAFISVAVWKSRTKSFALLWLQMTVLYCPLVLNGKRGRGRRRGVWKKGNTIPTQFFFNFILDLACSCPVLSVQVPTSITGLFRKPIFHLNDCHLYLFPFIVNSQILKPAERDPKHLSNTI